MRIHNSKFSVLSDVLTLDGSAFLGWYKLNRPSANAHFPPYCAPKDKKFSPDFLIFE
jgi:hypothetical protein